MSMPCWINHQKRGGNKTGLYLSGRFLVNPLKFFFNFAFLLSAGQDGVVILYVWVLEFPFLYLIFLCTSTFADVSDHGWMQHAQEDLFRLI